MAICGAFRASSAIRCSFVETLSRVCVLFIFLSSDSHARLLSPSLHGVPRAGSPASSVLWGAPTPRRLSRFTSFPSFRDITGWRIVRSLHRAPDATPGLDQRVVHPACFGENDEASQVSGCPRACAPCSWTPVGAQPLASRSFAFVVAGSNSRRLQRSTHRGWAG